MKLHGVELVEASYIRLIQGSTVRPFPDYMRIAALVAPVEAAIIQALATPTLRLRFRLDFMWRCDSSCHVLR